MTTALILTAINSGDATTVEGIRLRLHVAGVEVPELQNSLDGLLFVGTIKRSFAPNMNAMVYELTEQRKWEPEGTTEIVRTRAAHPERKLDWPKGSIAAEQEGVFIRKQRLFEDLVFVSAIANALNALEPAKTGFQVTPQNKPKPEPKKGLDLEKEILAVIGHDGPSAIKIFQRIKNRLELQDSELNFYDVRTVLDDMKAKHLVGYVKATETTNGGWVQLRVPKAFKK